MKCYAKSSENLIVQLANLPPKPPFLSKSFHLFSCTGKTHYLCISSAKNKEQNKTFLPFNFQNIGRQLVQYAASNCVQNQIPAIVHCIGGNNRSPLIVECLYFVLYQEHLPDEYKGCFNHLFYNLSNGHIPFILKEVEHSLSQLSNAITQDSFTELM